MDCLGGVVAVIVIVGVARRRGAALGRAARRVAKAVPVAVLVEGLEAEDGHVGVVAVGAPTVHGGVTVGVVVALGAGTVAKRGGVGGLGGRGQPTEGEDEAKRA